jgi:hypothetical protein
MSYAPPGDGGDHDVIGGDMSDDDQQILRLWRESLSLLDPRYEDKRLLRIAARAMVDDAFREDLAKEDEGQADGQDYEEGDAPGRLLFHVNTAKTLHVVLPPRAGEAELRPLTMRESLRSRTSANASNWFQDDWNVNDRALDPPIWSGQFPDNLDPAHTGDTNPSHNPFEGPH